MEISRSIITISLVFGILTMVPSKGISKNSNFMNLPVFCGIFSDFQSHPKIPLMVLTPLNEKKALIKMFLAGQTANGEFEIKKMKRFLDSKLGVQSIPYINTIPAFEPDPENRDEMAPKNTVTMDNGWKVSLAVIPGVEEINPEFTYWSAQVYVTDSKGKSIAASEIGCLPQP